MYNNVVLSSRAHVLSAWEEVRTSLRGKRHHKQSCCIRTISALLPFQKCKQPAISYFLPEENEEKFSAPYIVML